MQCSCNFLFISCSYLDVYVDERPLWLYVCMTRLVKRNYLVPTFSHYHSRLRVQQTLVYLQRPSMSYSQLDNLLCFNM